MAYIGQNEDEWEAAQRKKAREIAKKNTVCCQICSKRLKIGGPLKQHMRDVHRMKMVSMPSSPKLDTTEWTPIK
jgi:hypothetical protein